ncbi:hypothetical protein Gpo141_00007543 [Globisporangium polare]
MKVALLDGLLICAALLTAHTVISTDSALQGLQGSSSPDLASASAFVEVHGDAVYCVEGPICSGDVASRPIGTSCPKRGDMAIDACMKGVPSFSAADGQCVAPSDAECRVTPGTQVWGCMWTTEVSTESQADPVPASASSSPPSSSQAESIPQATPAHLRVADAAIVANAADSAATDGSSSHTIWIVSVAAAGGAIAVVAVVVVLKKRRRSQQQTRGDLKQVVIAPDNLPAATPKLSNTVFVYTAQI